MPFSAIWMDLEMVILSKWDREEKMLYNSPYMWNPERNDTNELTYKTETEVEKERMVARGRDREKG